MFAWLSSCCGAEDEKPRPSTAERRIVILRDQPALVPAPSAEPQWSSESAYEKTLELEREQELYEPRGRRYSRDNASIRNWFSKPSSSSSSTRRLQISGPTNFRHLHSESFQYPSPVAAPAPRVRPRSFRPLELSIYAPNNRLTPILPHLDCEDDFITPPPRVYTGKSSRWDASSGTNIAAPERSYSVMSFHIPRKHLRQSSGDSDAPLTMAAPRIPPKSRARASTAPNTDRIVARIASAMIVKERLQAEINSVVERQSIFFSSRPSTAIDPRDLEPMPSIPAIPAAAPSFAERLSVDDRPSTAPAHIKTQQNKTQELAQAAFHSYPPLTPYSPSRYEDNEVSDALERPLAPPLPLVLRPPLRKKKSFSRVSSWLQQNNNNNNNNNTPAKEGSIDESTLVTTSPRPVKEADGFYQCVAPPEGLPRTSMETSSSVYTSDNITTTDDDEDETKTAPTTNWSPGSSPRVKQLQMTPPIAERVRYFDGRAAQDGVLKAPPRPPMGLGLGVNNLGVAAGPRPLSVGVAF